MSLHCSISGEVPEQPVLSLVSNHVFERRLVEKHIKATGTDPITGQPLTQDQLVDIKVGPVAKPRPPSATSIPAILKLLQDEWDATMLQCFTTRQHLQTTRQELSHTLYQYDSACRAIARLSKEANAAREALATLKPQVGVTPSPAVVPVATMAVAAAPAFKTDVQEVPTMNDEIGISDEVILKLQEKATVLTSERKQRGKQVPEALASVSDLQSYRQTSCHSGLHSTSVPGILCMDLKQSDCNKVVTGGLDKNVVVFDRHTEQIVATLKGHTKKVSGVIYHPFEDVVVSGSTDSAVRVWNVSSASCSLVIKAHQGPVTAVSLHATGDYVLSSSSDQHWAFSDIRTGSVLVRCPSDTVSSQGLTCAEFHPDGLIFGTGTSDSVIKIWDLKDRVNVANFPGHSGSISTLAFSENGYYLATAADDSCVKLWDLRKLKNFRTIALEDRFEVQTLCFDKSGLYLSVGGNDIQIYTVKTWEVVKTFNDHSGKVTGVRFGRDASFIASVGMDRNLRMFGHV